MLDNSKKLKIGKKPNIPIPQYKTKLKFIKDSSGKKLLEKEGIYKKITEFELLDRKLSRPETNRERLIDLESCINGNFRSHGSINTFNSSIQENKFFSIGNVSEIKNKTRNNCFVSERTNKYTKNINHFSLPTTVTEYKSKTRISERVKSASIDIKNTSKNAPLFRKLKVDCFIMKEIEKIKKDEYLFFLNLQENVLNFDHEEKRDTVQIENLGVERQKGFIKNFLSENNKLNQIELNSDHKRTFYEKYLDYCNDVYVVPFIKNRMFTQGNPLLPRESKDFTTKFNSQNSLDKNTIKYLNSLRIKYQRLKDENPFSEDLMAEKENKEKKDKNKKISEMVSKILFKEAEAKLSSNNSKYKKYFIYKYENYNDAQLADSKVKILLNFK